VLRPGGLVCHTTWFIDPTHAAPKDLWRFTPDALRLLAEGAWRALTSARRVILSKLRLVR
jgi:hypothetical protein